MPIRALALLHLTPTHSCKNPRILRKLHKIRGLYLFEYSNNEEAEALHRSTLYLAKPFDRGKRKNRTWRESTRRKRLDRLGEGPWPGEWSKTQLSRVGILGPTSGMRWRDCAMDVELKWPR